MSPASSALRIWKILNMHVIVNFAGLVYTIIKQKLAKQLCQRAFYFLLKRPTQAAFLIDS